MDSSYLIITASIGVFDLYNQFFLKIFSKFDHLRNNRILQRSRDSNEFIIIANGCWMNRLLSDYAATIASYNGHIEDSINELLCQSNVKFPLCCLHFSLSIII